MKNSSFFHVEYLFKHLIMKNFFSIDVEDPVITCVSNQSVSTDNGMDTAMVVWNGPKASDNSGNVSRVICDPQSGTNFTIGQTNVICEAVDDSGNKAACYFQVNVNGKSLCSVYLYVKCSSYKHLCGGMYRLDSGHLTGLRG